MLQGADTPIRMLVIHDDLTEAEAIVSHLRNNGLAVRPTRPVNANALKEQLHAHPFDLLLLSLPSTLVSEQEVFHLVNASGHEVPVLVELEQINNFELMRLAKAGARALIPRGERQYLELVVRREFEDLIARRGLRQLEAQVRETERRCDALIESSRDPIAYVHEGMYIRANSAYLEMFGYDSFEDIEGISLLDMVAPAHATDFKQLLKDLARGHAPPHHELQMRDSEGNEFPAIMEFTQAKYEGEPCLQVVIRRQEIDPALAQEVEELRRRDEELRRLDIVTGLLNRQTFLQALEDRVADAANHGHEHALLLIELDHLSQLQQQVGLDNIDELPVAVARRLRRLVPESIPIARVGENTYAILMDNSPYQHTLELAEQIRSGFGSRLLDTTSKTLSTTVSIGGTQISERIALLSRVLGKANESLQEAAALTNQVHIFDPRATERVEEERTQAWLQHIREATSANALHLHYIPIVNLEDEQEQFHETLLLMSAKDGHLLPAGQFVPMAEEHSLAGMLDRWAIEQALRLIRSRQDQGFDQRILMTLSHHSMEDPTLLRDIEQILNETGAAGSRLILQLSEPKVFSNLRAVQQFTEGLRPLGIGFCISQFGIGLNLSQMLSHIQPRYVKLNNDLTNNFLESEESREQVARIIEETRAMQIACIAHGVKDAATMTRLFSSGVQYMEGDFIAPISERLG